MKAKELRIGSLINYNGIICKVEAISNEYVSVSGYEANRYIPVKIEDAKGIVLTKEHLLDSGFWKVYHNLVDIFDKYRLRIYLAQTGASNVFFTEPNSTTAHYFISIEYVHELQNLYFAMTGEELTITKDFTDK